MMKSTFSSFCKNQCSVFEKNTSENNEKKIELKKCVDQCNQQDLKLREAEKTIANKDVIIKMLQNQVKKLEESCKQNVKQSEEFRYKYCLATEKMKRLKSCTNNKCKGNQQNQKNYCNNDNCKFDCKITEQQGKEQNQRNDCNNDDCQFNEQGKQQNQRNYSNNDNCKFNNEQQGKEQNQRYYCNNDDCKFNEQQGKEQNQRNDCNNDDCQFNEQGKQQNQRNYCNNNCKLNEQQGKEQNQRYYCNNDDCQFNEQGKQQNQRNYCNNDNCKFNEQQAQSCAGNFLPQCLPEDPTICNRTFLQSHYAVLQILVDEIVKRRYNIAPCSSACVNNLPNENQDENREVGCSQCRRDIIPESQKQSNTSTVEDTKLEKKISEDKTSEEICMETCLGSQTCNQSISNEQSNVENQEVNEDMRKDSSSCPPSGCSLSCDKTKLEENKLDELEEAAEQTNDTIYINSKNGDETSNSQIASEGDISEKSNKDVKGTDVSVLKRSGSIVHAVDSFTIHHRHLSICTSKEMKDDNDSYTFPQKSNGDGNNLSKSIVSFHMVPVIFDEVESKSVNIDDKISTIEHEEQIRAQDLYVTNTNAEKNTICARPSNASSCRSNLYDIKNEITILAGKQETTYKELQNMRSEINTTRTCALTCNEEILKLKNIVEEQKNTFLANFQENKIITDNLTNVTEKLTNELKEVKSKIENLFKIIEESNKQQPNNNNDSCRDNKLPTDSEISNKTKCMPCEMEESCRTFQSGEPDDYCKLEDNYEELKKQTFEKDQQIQCLNNLIRYYNKLNEEILCLCPILSTDSQEKSLDTNKSLSECNCNDKTDKKNESVNDTQKLEYNCLPLYSQSENFSCEDEFVYNENCEEIQIEDIYNSVLKCTKKSSSVYTPRSVKSLMCSCNLNFEKSKKKMSIEDIYEAVRCSCKQRREGRKDECISSVSSGSCMLHCDTLICDKSLHSNLQAYVNYLQEQLQVISTIESQIENLRTDIKSSN